MFTYADLVEIQQDLTRLILAEGNPDLLVRIESIFFHRKKQRTAEMTVARGERRRKEKAVSSSPDVLGIPKDGRRTTTSAAAADDGLQPVVPPPAAVPESSQPTLMTFEWEPTAADLAKITSGANALSEDAVPDALDEFREYHLERGEPHQNWSALFRSWCRKRVREGWDKPRKFLPKERRRKKKAVVPEAVVPVEPPKEEAAEGQGQSAPLVPLEISERVKEGLRLKIVHRAKTPSAPKV